MYNISRTSFDIEDVSREDCLIIAEAIEEYIGELEEVMIIPDEVEKKYGKEIRESLKICKKLVKKLKRYDIEGVFKDPDEFKQYELT